jgi:hypothetical protein
MLISPEEMKRRGWRPVPRVAVARPVRRDRRPEGARRSSTRRVVRRGGAKAASGDPPSRGDDPPSDQLRRWPDEAELSRLSPFARTWRFSIETLATAEEIDHLAAQASIRAIWIGRAA